MRKFFIVCGSAFLGLILSVASAHAWHCQQSAVGSIIALSAALNLKVSPHCGSQPFCKGGPIIRSGMKKIASHGNIPQWIVSSFVVSPPYSITQQNNFIATAQNLGNANKPAGTFIRRINFFWEYAGSEYVLGADIYYGRCISVPDSSVPQ